MLSDHIADMADTAAEFAEWVWSAVAPGLRWLRAFTWRLLLAATDILFGVLMALASLLVASAGAVLVLAAIAVLVSAGLIIVAAAGLAFSPLLVIGVVAVPVLWLFCSFGIAVDFRRNGLGWKS